MKINKGVEWAAHACTLLALLPRGASLSGEALATYLEVPQPYLAKQMQALSRAGIVKAQRGASGGYQLARPAEAISLWQITAAIEGSQPSFRCTEIRRAGPCGLSPVECRKPCAIAGAFAQAEAGYRAALDAVSLTQLVEDAAATTGAASKRAIVAWIEEEAVERA
jgi:Rrf2 family protein